MTRTIDIVVRLEIDEDAEVQDVVGDMDYVFDHPAIHDAEIVDIITEL